MATHRTNEILYVRHCAMSQGHMLEKNRQGPHLCGAYTTVGETLNKQLNK